MKRITIVSGIQLCSNPRVVKEADALSAAGYQVRVLAGLYDPAMSAREDELIEGCSWEREQVVRVGQGSRLRWQWLRARARLSRAAYRWTGWSDVRQLGYVGPELLRACLRNVADLYIVHMEQGLWVGSELLARGLPVAVDFEDWYSEDLLPEDRSQRPVELLAEWERRLLREALYATTTSRALSEALAAAYDCRAPLVVPNTFSWKERDGLDGERRDRRDRSRLSICWYSQRIGPGRGLEDLMRATEFFEVPVEIHLRGTCRPGTRDQLLELAAPAFRDHIYFHEQVPHAELLSRLAEHDIGYAGEQQYCPSRDLTITNKILQYLLAGVPVLATATAGQREVARECPDAVRVFPVGDAERLAAHVNATAASWDVSGARQAALDVARVRYHWEASQTVLLDAVARAIGPATASTDH